MNKSQSLVKLEKSYKLNELLSNQSPSQSINNSYSKMIFD